jgi:hypothetical protein
VVAGSEGRHGIGTSQQARSGRARRHCAAHRPASSSTATIRWDGSTPKQPDCHYVASSGGGPAVTLPARRPWPRPGQIPACCIRVGCPRDRVSEQLGLLGASASSHSTTTSLRPR